MVAYVRHQLSSPRQGQMKIDSLLNPPSDDGRDEYGTTVSSYNQRTIISPSSHSGSYSHSPIYSPSLNHYWYRQYQRTSPGIASTARRHVNSNSNHREHAHHYQSQRQSKHPGSGHRHHHHMFLSYRPTKASSWSSPDPCDPHEQFDSISSSSSNNADRPRPLRPKYNEEEMYFIWYHRVDLCQQWKEVRESFNRQFPNRQRQGFQGIQCKFYRFIREKKCPTLREQWRMRKGEFLSDGTSNGAWSGAPRFGVREWTNVWFPWMGDVG